MFGFYIDGRVVMLVAMGLMSAIPVQGIARQSELRGRERLEQQAIDLRPVFKSELGQSFLNAVRQLPKRETRSVFVNRENPQQVLAAAATELMSREALEAYDEKRLDEHFYYFTRYGSPLAFGRALEVLADQVGTTHLGNQRVVDFGFGSIGHLRMMASMGADVTGIEVDRTLAAVYSDPTDTGEVSDGQARGKLELLFGRFPGELGDRVRDHVDIFVSKNTLKRGYIHPAQKVNPKLLVQLGVSDKQFLDSVHGKLNDGGLFLIYNLHPAQADEGQPYIPWADGRSPFDRDQLIAAGFDVLAFDRDDTTAAREMARTLGWQKQMDLEQDLFATFTLVRKRSPQEEQHARSISNRKGFEGNRGDFLGKPLKEQVRLFSDQRFPNIVVSRQGTVIATWGNDGVVARRSVDAGRTWSDPIRIAAAGIHGGGTTVDLSSGDILAFVEKHHPPAPTKMFRSRDDGNTWHAESLSVKTDSLGNLPSMHMNEHGITLRHGPHAGRLVRASRYYGLKNDRSEWPRHYTNAVFSDDGGKHWKTSDPFPENGTGEATVAQLADGSIYYNSRLHWQERPKNTRRRSAVSTDGGQTWKQWKIVDALPDGHQHRSYGCMGGLVRLPVAGHDILVFSNLDTPNAKRERVTVWASFDGGKTWPIKRLVHDGPSAYSSLNAGWPGTPSAGWIFLHFENGSDGGSSVARFNLSWILQGELTGDGQIPADLKGIRSN